MPFKFSIGQAVEYKPMGQSTGLFKVVRHMPEEDHAQASKYLIKSLTEGFERIVHEFDLEPSDGDESKYVAAPSRRGSASRN
jgi:hypothetical protein